MYKVLSWDIGVKNLSYCILQENSNIEGNEVSSANRTKHNYSILNWEVINLYPDEIKVEYECSGLTSKKQICGKKSKYINDNKYYCKTHAPKDNLTNLITNITIILQWIRFLECVKFLVKMSMMVMLFLKN